MLLIPAGSTSNLSNHTSNLTSHSSQQIHVKTDVVEYALGLCGITSKDTIDAVKAEGLQSLGDFGHLFTEKQVGQFAESIRSRHNGAHNISYMSTRKLRGLAFWVRKSCPETAKIESLTQDILDEACRDLDSAHRTERIIPNRLKRAEVDIGLGWFQLKNRILHKFRTMTSAIGGNVTLNYVVRPTGKRPPGRGPWNNEEYRISLQNEYFPADNKTVALFLADVLMDTPMYLLVRHSLDNNDGRKAWLQLVKEAESEERAKQRYEHVSKKVADFKYTGNEAEFPFHEYATNMRIYFNMLDENGKNYRFEDFEKVFMLLDQLELSQPILTQETIKILENGNSPNFEQCIEKISKIVAENRHLLAEKPRRSSGGTGASRKKKRRRI